jgi:hypothetical protein
MALFYHERGIDDGMKALGHVTQGAQQEQGLGIQDEDTQAPK